MTMRTAKPAESTSPVTDTAVKNCPASAGSSEPGERRESSPSRLAERRVVRPEREPVPFEQHREVGGFLQLDEQDVPADRVGHPGRAQDRVAGVHRHLVRGAE